MEKYQVWHTLFTKNRRVYQEKSDLIFAKRYIAIPFRVPLSPGNRLYMHTYIYNLFFHKIYFMGIRKLNRKDNYNAMKNIIR